MLPAQKKQDALAAYGPAAASGFEDAAIVLIDDDEVTLEVLSTHLDMVGYKNLTKVSDPTRLGDILRVQPPDLILTDLQMPKVSGFDVVCQVRATQRLAHVPVIMVTSAGDEQTKLDALELGATDFLAKPVVPLELALRVRNNLRTKFFQDELMAEGRASEGLLNSLLPTSVAERLKRGENVADYYDDATVLFADLVDFTRFASQLGPGKVVERLNQVFRSFDLIVERHGLEKIKTIGDAYMLAGGIPERRDDHAAAVVEAALNMISACERLSQGEEHELTVRIGIHTGPVMAGVIGKRRYAYDLWGDTVNVASRMESSGMPGRIHVSKSTARAVESDFRLEHRGAVEIKGKGVMSTSFVLGRSVETQAAV